MIVFKYKNIKIDHSLTSIGEQLFKRFKDDPVLRLKEDFRGDNYIRFVSQADSHLRQIPNSA